MTNPDFQQSADAHLLTQFMQKAQVGETITFAQMSAVVSKPVHSNSTGVRTSLKRLLRDHHMVFSSVRGVGFQRLDDASIIAEGGHAADSIRRKAKRSIERQMKVDFVKLTREQQGRFTAQVSVMAGIALMTRQTELDRVAAASPTGVKELPIAQTLRMFSGG